MTPVAIVGGGITGLTAAYYLQQKNIPVTVYESSARTGGMIQTVASGGFLAEQGPNTILETSAAVSGLVKDLGLTSRRMYPAPGMEARYVVRDGRPVRLPQSAMDAVRTPLLSLRAKIRVLGDLFVRRGVQDDETLSSFVTRRLGCELLDYVIDPFVGGVYAGDPDRLSVHHAFPKLEALEQRYGSLIGGTILGARERKKRHEVPKAKAPMLTFDGGLGVLVNALQSSLGASIRLQTAVTGLRRGQFGWSVDTPAGTSEHSAVLLCAPAHQVARINMDSERQEELDVLREVYYPPLARVAVGFRSEQIAHGLDGFGILIPQKEKMNSLGILFSSSMFPNRAPAGHMLLTAYLGGSRRSELVHKTDSELVAMALADMRTLLGASGVPVFQNVVRIIRSIPQYNVGYGEVKDTIDHLETESPGLFIAGNYRDGISVADCIQGGVGACGKVTGYLSHA